MTDGWRPQIEKLLGNVSAAGVDVAPGTGERLTLFCHEMADWSDRAGLISPHDMPHLVTKHIAASIGPLLISVPEMGQHWIDVGTGGGLPGMIIAICRPDLSITLIDSKHRKTIFLERIKDLIGLEQVTVIEGRVEEINPPVSGEPVLFDLVLMRAVTSLKKSLPLIDTITRSGSRLITFKGPGWREEAAAAEKTVQKYGWCITGAEEIPWAQPRLLHLTRETCG